MFWQSTKVQVDYLLKKKSTICVFFFLLIAVLVNFVDNVLTFQGKDVVEMYHPMKLLLLSFNRTDFKADRTILFVQLYPILVAVPAGFAFSVEKQLGINVYLESKLGGVVYKWSKIVASFLVTTIVFTVPFLIEIGLNCIAFPLNAMGDLSNWGYYNSDYIEGVQRYLLSGLFIKNGFMYTIICTLMFGIVSGMLGALTVACSFLIRVKYNIFLFLPVFILLNLGVMLTENQSISTRWYDYMLIFNDAEKNIWYYFVSLFVMLVLIVIATFKSVRKDCL